MSLSYAELGARSAFSFLEGASEPEELALRAAELELDCVALGDRGGVYGAPRFHRACKRHGVRAIVGATIDVEEVGWMRLLCESQRGYRHLCRLLTVGHRDRPKGQCVVDLEQLEEYAAGLTCLVGPGLSERRVDRVDLDLLNLIDRLKGTFGDDTVAIEVWRHLDRAEQPLSNELFALAEASGLPAVATNDVRHARSKDKPLLDVLTCIRQHTTLDDAGRLLLPNAERRLKSSRQMIELFVDRPEAVRHSRVIAERCSFTLDNLGYRFPNFPVPPGETPTSFLHRLTFEGARVRYRPLTSKAIHQLNKELALIEKLELEGYFLIVWDIVRFAQQHDIMVQGRGSAANSAVCYALEITAVDPVGMDLLFERFLSEEREQWPDIDLDLPSGDKRETVIQHVYEKYGPHGAAMTANVITYRDRSALREVGKALGFLPRVIDRAAKIGGRWGNINDRQQLTERLRGVGLDPDDRRTQLWMHLSRQILHLPRHLGQHSGGMVIAAGRLDEITPVEPATMENRAVVQWDKDDCSSLGIIKIDLLGLGMLAALEEVIPLVRDSEGIELDFAHIPKDDPGVYDMLCKADTVGLFQVESRAQMATLPRLKPRCFYDLVVEIALIRPGPISGQMVHPYLRRRAGLEPVDYIHPDLEAELRPILERTLGVPIFQEQVMRLAMVVAGFSGGEAEELRRAMGFKRSNERMQEIDTRLRRGMQRRGLSRKTQDDLVKYITSFASYGFPESHSASFALIAYASAYLKFHHAAAFVCALLNAYPLGFYHPSTLIKDAQRHGVSMRSIDVTRSSWSCTLQDKNTVRLGMRYVMGLKQSSAERIITKRGMKPFGSLADFERRCSLSENELMTLAELGAFCELGQTRRQALWQVSRLRQRTEGLLGAAEPRANTSPLPEMTLTERIVADLRNSEMSVGPHLMHFWRADLDERGILSAHQLLKRPDGSLAKVAGWAITTQRPGAGKIFFITLEDETGFANIIVMPEMFEANRALIMGNKALVAEGIVQNREGVVHLKAGRFVAMDEV